MKNKPVGNMGKKKVFIPLISLVLLPWGIPFFFNKSLKSWITHWWNTTQSETLLNAIQEKGIVQKFIELEELFLLEGMIKEEPDETKLHVGIQRETIELLKVYNEDCIDTILNFSTNLISFIILSAYSFWGHKELAILNSWVQEFLCNLSDTVKALTIITLTDLFTGHHSTRSWELVISSIYKDFGFSENDRSISFLVSIFPVLVNIAVKYWTFQYLNKVSPSLVIIYRSLEEFP